MSVLTITDASTTRRPVVPLTKRSGVVTLSESFAPMAAVETGCHTDAVKYRQDTNIASVMAWQLTGKVANVCINVVV